MRFKIKRASDSIFNPGKPCDRAGFVGPGQRRWKTRLCKVNNKLGYFHTWEHYSRPVEASLLVGGAPAGVIGQVFGIVEFSDGVKRVQPYEIQFCDEINAYLTVINAKKGESDDVSDL